MISDIFKIVNCQLSSYPSLYYTSHYKFPVCQLFPSDHKTVSLGKNLPINVKFIASGRWWLILHLHFHQRKMKTCKITPKEWMSNGNKFRDCYRWVIELLGAKVLQEYHFNSKLHDFLYLFEMPVQIWHLLFTYLFWWKHKIVKLQRTWRSFITTLGQCFPLEDRQQFVHLRSIDTVHICY